MHIPKRILFLCLLFCLPCCFAFAQGLAPSRLTIPGGPPGVYLTMPLKELLAQRKNIKALSIFDDRPIKDRQIDPESKRGMLLEDYKNTQFQHGIYFIQDGKLLVLGAFSEYQGKVPASVRKNFLTDLVKVYGQPDSAIVVTEGTGKYNYNIPALFWHLPTATVSATITPDTTGSGAPIKSVIEVKIYASEYIVDGRKSPIKVPYNVPQITNAQREKILAPLLASLKKIPVSVKK